MSAWSRTRTAVKDADAITMMVAEGIVRDLKDLFGNERTLLPDDFDKIQGIVDGHLDRAYGSTRPRALRSALYQSIHRNVYMSANREYERFFADLARRLNRHDATRWGRLESAIMADGGALAGVFGSLNGAMSAEERRRRARMFDPNRRWVSRGGYRLSDRVWRQGRRSRKQINKIVQQGIRQGSSVATVSRRLDRYLNPSHSPVVYRRDGRIVRVRQGTGGGGASGARRLARTEMSHYNNLAAKEYTRQVSEVVPGVGIAYRLSPAHPKIDVCDLHANNSSPGMPKGVYLVQSVPMIPQHPNCLCRYEPHTMPPDEFMEWLERRYFGDLRL